MRIVIILLFLGIVYSLGSGLFYLNRGKDDSGRLAKALAWRITLSVVLFATLIVAGVMGWVEPGGA